MLFRLFFANLSSLSAWEKKGLVPRSAMCCLFFSLGCLLSKMRAIHVPKDFRQQDRCRQKHYNRCAYELQAVLRLQLYIAGLA